MVFSMKITISGAYHGIPWYTLYYTHIFQTSELPMASAERNPFIVDSCHQVGSHLRHFVHPSDTTCYINGQKIEDCPHRHPLIQAWFLSSLGSFHCFSDLTMSYEYLYWAK